MSTPHDVGYPTQGEVIRFLFNAAGVLPEKRDQVPLDAKRRAAIRKVLERLATEEGELEENFDEMARQLADLAGAYLELEPVRQAAEEVVGAVLQAYRDCVRQRGTYLSKAATLRWVVREIWLPAVAHAIALAVTRYNLRPLAAWLPPDADWFLPRSQDGVTTTPLATVMRWIYDSEGVSQTQFHYPDRPADEHDAALRQALDNAQHWSGGSHLPSAPALRWTFERAAARPGAAPPEPMTVAGRQIALFLARCATFLATALESAFGAEFLRETRDLFAHRLALALRDAMSIERHIADLAERSGVPALAFDLRSHAIDVAEHDLADRKRRMAAELARLGPGSWADVALLERFAQAHGDYAVLDLVPRERLHDVPPHFEDGLREGRGLWKQREPLALVDIDRYERRLADTGVDRLLPWIVPWLRFLVFYRSEDFEAAWPWVERAYELARYRAGADQYPIVNHYIEMTAKRRDRVAFRKGINWARYIELDVRWLREREPTPENLDFAMEILARARYGV